MVFDGHFLNSKVLFIEIFVNIFQSRKLSGFCKKWALLSNEQTELKTSLVFFLYEEGVRKAHK